ncbi:origin recognition complex subunit 1 (ORC1), putative [Trypanosoma equiperdum]|uniref:Origin recognition complex subunit 1 n=3 Tax=Trypanozoon TaxID=39700 RepID=Q384U5_TRYB2|nr:cell division cycle 6 (CDC6), putative [Trypanosoma brucei gambiense DAL972]XP_828798.1 origin recognition complex subunit 1 [Trypanosoma brucei brucei TREU927]EAN79686.1 origin recognition complex subunit 1 (ORC1), putative [Trypanosoma brucei brucei TREU927]CBH17703.1 cell division cycle 6 (CDC6), putative [Trypanosoma brucei gambiense DAL972]SCU70827.1 origin recognition complex subunit 1 (ORC1), putative [Trypanosoma equiperdum]|eukprot:XP_011779967.1 cell division cycle 6 (CDC6), putative [Trypanosoma brucei gambiense DAL972]
MKRRRDSNGKSIAALRAGVAALSVSSNIASRELTCRDSHVKAILDFLNDKVHPVMQVFGMPGTGKTASVNHALALLASSSPAGSKPTAVFLNGYIIQKTSDIYWTLNSHLSKTRLKHAENCLPEQCPALIEKRFKQGWGSSTTPLCVIVVDEVDKVLKKHNKAFFRIVDWLSLPYAFCKLITISNSMELAADAKTRSRLDITKRLVFEPYSLPELKEIILRRVSHIKPTLFAEKAINYLCNQTASHYGDVRRLLQSASSAICGLMMRIEEGYKLPEKHDGLLTVKDVHSVVRQIFHDRFVEFIQTIRLPVVFISVAVIAVETARLFRANCEDSRLPIDSLFTATKRAQERFGSVFADLHAVTLNYGAYLEIVEMLREVALIDVSVGEERIPVKTVQSLLEATERAHASMLQPFQTVVDACKLHDDFGTGICPLFSI